MYCPYSCSGVESAADASAGFLPTGSTNGGGAGSPKGETAGGYIGEREQSQAGVVDPRFRRAPADRKPRDEPARRAAMPDCRGLTAWREVASSIDAADLAAMVDEMS